MYAVRRLHSRARSYHSTSRARSRLATFPPFFCRWSPYRGTACPTLRLAPMFGTLLAHLCGGLQFARLQPCGLACGVFVNACRVRIFYGVGGVLCAGFLCGGRSRAGVGPRRARSFAAFTWAGYAKRHYFSAFKSSRIAYKVASSYRSKNSPNRTLPNFWSRELLKVVK